MMCFVGSYLLQLPQIIYQGLSTRLARVKLFCLSFDIHYEHIKIFCDLFWSSPPDIQLGSPMQISQNYVHIWKIQQEFLDIAHGRFWQNFPKTEQEKLRGKLDSANSNFRLPPSNAFARVLLSLLLRRCLWARIVQNSRVAWKKSWSLLMFFRTRSSAWHPAAFSSIAAHSSPFAWLQNVPISL